MVQQDNGRTFEFPGRSMGTVKVTVDRPAEPTVASAEELRSPLDVAAFESSVATPPVATEPTTTRIKFDRGDGFMISVQVPDTTGV